MDGYWLLDLTGHYLPAVRWISYPPPRKFSGGEHGTAYVWFDRFGNVDTEIRLKAGVVSEYRAPRRQPTVYRFKPAKAVPQ